MFKNIKSKSKNNSPVYKEINDLNNLTNQEKKSLNLSKINILLFSFLRKNNNNFFIKIKHKLFSD